MSEYARNTPSAPGCYQRGFILTHLQCEHNKTKNKKKAQLQDIHEPQQNISYRILSLSYTEAAASSHSNHLISQFCLSKSPSTFYLIENMSTGLSRDMTGILGKTAKRIAHFVYTAHINVPKRVKKKFREELGAVDMM